MRPPRCKRSLASLPGREAEFQRGIHQALQYATAWACPRIHVMAGLLPAGCEREARMPTGNVAHIQIAGVPERHEPDGGELNYPYLFALLDELGYAGWVGCEYRPRLGVQVGGTSAGLEWLKDSFQGWRSPSS